MSTTTYRQLAAITAMENLLAAWQRVAAKKAADHY